MTINKMRKLLVAAKKAQLETDYAEWVTEQVNEFMSRWEEENPCPSEDDEGIDAVYKWEEWREQIEEETESNFAAKSVELAEIDLEQYEMGLDDNEVEKQFKTFEIKE